MGYAADCANRLARRSGWGRCRTDAARRARCLGEFPEGISCGRGLRHADQPPFGICPGTYDRLSMYPLLETRAGGASRPRPAHMVPEGDGTVRYPGVSNFEE